MAESKVRLKYHGKDRARIKAVQRSLTSIKNRNAKIPLANMLSTDDLNAINTLLADMIILLAQTVVV